MKKVKSMKNLLFIIMLVFIASSAFAQQNEKKEKEDANKELKQEAAKIGKQLSLDPKKEHLVYNVLCHVKKRISDVPLGHENYEKLIGYIDEERVSMLQGALSAKEYKQYENVFGQGEKHKMEQLVAKNTEFVKNNGVQAVKVTSADIIDDQFFDKSEENPDESDDDESEENPKK